MGLGVAAQPQDALQPRLGRPRRQTVERAQAIRVVGRGPAALDRRGRSRLPCRQAAELPSSAGHRRPRRARRRRSLHHAGRREGLAVRPQWPARRAAADALRAGGVAGAQSAVQAAVQPHQGELPAPGEPHQPVASGARQRGVPLRGHHLPVDRAPHRRRHEPLPSLPLRAAAGVLLRGVARAGARAQPGQRWLGDHRQRAHRGRGPRVGDRAPGAAADRRPGDPSGGPPLSLGGRWQRRCQRRFRQRPARHRARPQRAHPGIQGSDLRHPPRASSHRAGAAALRRRAPAPRGHHRDYRQHPHDPTRGLAVSVRASGGLLGPLNPARGAGWQDPPPRKGFFTDTSLCIGCKACEVACKEWNRIPEDGLAMLGTSYDNTGGLGASTWRHVAFIEQRKPMRMLPVANGMGDSPASGAASDVINPARGAADFRWLMSSDVCKHCTHAACLDVCPTGALMRTELGTVVVQEDICNGCGYCVPACPFGVIERREGDRTVHNAGVAQKCTLCYDRIGEGMTPACAQACPTESIQFGDLEELRERARERVGTLRAAGVSDARLYLDDQKDGIGGGGAFFLLLDEPEVYGLPPDPVVSTRELPAMWRTAAVAGLGLLAGAAAAFAGRRR
ncbi:MAG: 4Fe-4S dicluster domain-containing protein [Candidatus Dormibacteraeota bacterium]|uniref:4Fe-4S dicluster domain-containing protein n=1 Tax=Candidatus Amunia macphersoniae TaxID=3127014 RepID=A0A934KE51_9BACT|nr:4Fe-4S dicluster domain-containing protein [Candidatus Dormibacteraeota bacterium]